MSLSPNPDSQAARSQRALSDRAPAGAVEQADVPTGPTEAEARSSSRRVFFCRSARRLAYVAPVVLLIRPRQAFGSTVYS